MWTVAHRARYGCSRLRYPSDLTEKEWALVRPQVPRAKRCGNKRSVKPLENGPTARRYPSGSIPRQRQTYLATILGP